MVERATEQLRRPTHAGSQRRRRLLLPLEQIAPDHLEHVLAVNVRGVLLGLQAALPALRQAEAPSVVVTSSISGMAGDPFMSAYCASKAAVANLVRTAAVELGHEGIRVNAVSPGATRTTMTKPFLGRGHRLELDLFRRRIPLKRFAEPPEIAAVITFLASPCSLLRDGRGRSPSMGGSRRTSGSSRRPIESDESPARPPAGPQRVLCGR